MDELYRLWLVTAKAILEWLEGVVGRLAAGEYVMADDEGVEFGAPGSAD